MECGGFGVRLWPPLLYSTRTPRGCLGVGCRLHCQRRWSRALGFYGDGTMENLHLMWSLLYCAAFAHRRRTKNKSETLAHDRSESLDAGRLGRDLPAFCWASDSADHPKF